MKKLLVLIFMLIPTLASAYTQRNPCYGPSANSSSCIGVTTDTPLPVIGQGGVGPYSYTPLTPMQSGLTVATATSLTVPSGATYAVVCARGQNVNYTTDGITTPTISVGMQLLQNQCVNIVGATVIANFKAIQQSATATLDVSYFK